jgi:23S rRNA pseudouridine1911/1915/1917 synthase
MPSIAFVVDRRENGQTLAAVLKLRYGLSWSQAKRLVERRHVKVSGQVETDVAKRLKVGKRVELDPGTIEGQKAQKQVAAPPKKSAPRKTPKPFTPKQADVPGLEIVYADDAIVVVNKPAGLTTMRHRDEAEEFGTRARKFLPKTLADHLPVLLGLPDHPVIAVHRIDRDTSGLVVFARKKSVAQYLLSQFRKHRVERLYLALTRGVPKDGKIESIFVRDRGDGRRGSSTEPSPDAKFAATLVRCLAKVGEYALVECRLETGRTHQVRIHLGECGAPLCGETVYDRPLNGQPLQDGSSALRPMLHAASLGFKHPETGEAMKWEAPPPADFQQVRAELRLS